MGIVKLLKNSFAIIVGFLIVYSAMSAWSREAEQPTISNKNITPKPASTNQPSGQSHAAPVNLPFTTRHRDASSPVLQNKGNGIIPRTLVQDKQFQIITRIHPGSGIPGSKIALSCPGVYSDSKVKAFLNGKSAVIDDIKAGRVVIEIPDHLQGLANVEVLTEKTYYQRISGVSVLRPRQGSPYFAHPEIVSQAADNVHIVVPADLDLDGDVDMISASHEGGKIAWLKNLDGQGQFGYPRVINDEITAVITIGAVDLDGDGDLDVYAISGLDSQFVWFENINGLGRFSLPKTIPAIREPLEWAECADVDGDGDLDILTAGGAQSGVLAWYENMDGRGTFGNQHVIARSAQTFRWISTGDLNGDGDLDVLSASAGDDVISWYVNIGGSGTFSAPQVITSLVDGAEAAVPADLNGDGKMDVLSASSGDSKIAWYRNRDGRGVFGNQVTISTTPSGARAASAHDFDADGDLDVLSSSYSGGRIVWFENEGDGEFNTEHTITDEFAAGRFVQAVDVDSDGDLDVVAASFSGDKILLFRQLSGFVGNNVRTNIPRTFRLVQNYPNPFNPSTTIRYSLPEASKVELVVIDAVGQKVITLVQGYEHAGYKSVVWDGRDSYGKILGSGVYFYRIKAGHFQESKKMILVR